MELLHGPGNEAMYKSTTSTQDLECIYDVLLQCRNLSFMKQHLYSYTESMETAITRKLLKQQ